MKLTKAAIDRLKFAGATPTAKDVRWDDAVPGFGVRVWASGKKTFVLAYRFHGRQRYLTLGEYGSLTPDEARKLATQRRADVLRGIDPLAVKQKLARGEKVKDLAAAYIERHAKPRNKTWQKDQERIDRYVNPALGAMKIEAVSRRDVARLHHQIGKTRATTANRVIALLSSMFNQARLWGFLAEGAVNPASQIERFPEKKRDRFVSEGEMPKLAAAIDAEQSVFIRALIWLYLFTGLRKTELMSLKWSDIDLKGGQLRLEDTKGGRPLYLPLSSEAVYMFKQIPKLHKNPYIFCGRIEGRPLVNISDAWQRIRREAGLTDVRLHDLRRTVGSWLAESGASLPLIGSILNHAKLETTQVYARFGQKVRADALEAHGQRIRIAAGVHLPANPDAAAAATDSSDVD